MFKLLFILFLVVPLLEIYLLIEIGGQIGPIATVSLVLFTAALGVFLLRLQGLATLNKVRTSLDKKELPAIALVEGLFLLVAGALLLTPGFFTDFVGFVILIPPVRARFAAVVLHALIISQQKHSEKDQENILEGEFWEDDR